MPQRIIIAGASGLIGTALCRALASAGADVYRLVRGAASRPNEIRWDPERGELDAAMLEGAGAVVHLGGASIARRFTEAGKREIRQSRIAGATLLAGTIVALRKPPSAFVCASAVGWYGDRGDEIVDEGSAPGSGFLAEVCREWESAAALARVGGTRVVHARLGVVLSARGGALRGMLTPFRLGLGGVIGGGRQWMSWIALDDAVAALQRMLGDESLAGPVNVVSPNPATNREFTRALGRVLRRPVLLPLPAFAVRLLLGEMGRTLLLDGCRATPRALLAAGFQFRYADLDAALRAALADGG